MQGQLERRVDWLETRHAGFYSSLSVCVLVGPLGHTIKEHLRR